MASQKIVVLVVAYWPLGGIRTYMKYTYKYLPQEKFELIILARRTHEEEALLKDADELGVRLFTINSPTRRAFLFNIMQVLRLNKVDIIQSHGFISGIYVALINYFFRVPHILTIHGILEDKIIGKGLGRLVKRKLMSFLFNRLMVLYAVSQDILDHVESSLDISRRVKRVVLHNGIDVETFLKSPLKSNSSIRDKLHISDSTFLVGFIGRFMAQKGFDYLIEAIDILEQKDVGNSLKVLAVGSGDYLDYYKKNISNKGLTHKFIFIPFQADIRPIFEAVDILAMPSIWEACPLQPPEAFVYGLPIIVTNCIGLREIVEGTPAVMIPSKDTSALAEAIDYTYRNPQKELFQQYKKRAVERYDVRRTSFQLGNLFESLLTDSRHVRN